MKGEWGGEIRIIVALSSWWVNKKKSKGSENSGVGKGNLC